MNAVRADVERADAVRADAERADAVRAGPEASAPATAADGMEGVTVLPELDDPVEPVLFDRWYVVATLEDVRRQRQRARLFGRNLVVWAAGDQVQVWQDVCVHMGFPLSALSPNARGRRDQEEAYRRGVLKCGYHGYEYGPDGRVVRIPQHPTQKIPPHFCARKTYPVQVRYGLVFTCLGTPRYAIPPFPEWDDPAWRKIFCGPYDVNAGASRFWANFADVAHFPWVHGDELGDPAHATVEPYRLRKTATGVVAENIRIYQPDPDGSGQGAVVTYTYEALGPTEIRFHKVARHCYGIIMFITPVERERCRGYMINFLNYDDGRSDEDFRRFEDRIVAEDRVIIEAQRPALIPADLRREPQRPADALAAWYRNFLIEQGMHYLIE